CKSVSIVVITSPPDIIKITISLTLQFTGISDIGFLCISISDDTIVNAINATNRINKLKLKDTNVKTRTHPVGLSEIVNQKTLTLSPQSCSANETSSPSTE
ncbi:476_t:CDS:2, partial [Diversispora eburnea]